MWEVGIVDILNFKLKTTIKILFGTGYCEQLSHIKYGRDENPSVKNHFFKFWVLCGKRFILIGQTGHRQEIIGSLWNPNDNEMW